MWIAWDLFGLLGFLLVNGQGNGVVWLFSLFSFFFSGLSLMGLSGVFLFFLFGVVSCVVGGFFFSFFFFLFGDTLSHYGYGELFADVHEQYICTWFVR